MTQVLDAVFEDGKFRLTEGQRVRPTVDAGVQPEDVLALAGQVYAGLSDEEVEAVERIALDRRAFFGDRAG